MGKFDYPVYGKSFLDDIFPVTPFKAPEPVSKTFYVIARNGHFSVSQYRGAVGPYDGGPWKNKLADATRHITLADAARELVVAIDKKNTDARIVRVTEVPGKSELRIVSKTKIDATKPVVHFNANSSMYSKRGVGASLDWALGLQDATVYSDLSEAVNAFAQSRSAAALLRGAVNPDYDGTLASAGHFHQVERITTPSTFTEVVVS